MTAPGQPRLIAFEGLDGTGKSHLTRVLAETLGIPRAVTPGDLYRGVRAPLHAAGGLASYLMYLSACAWAVESAQRSGERALVVDRYWFSSAVQHGWNCGASPAEALSAPCLPHSLLPRPELTVLLLASREARLNRLSRRPGTGSQLGDPGPRYEEYWTACAALLRDDPRAGGAVLVLDTTESDTGRAMEPLLAHPVVRTIADPAVRRLAGRGAKT
ncbi:hypothetical protein [Amycolatopsis sp. NPDC051102]|uniref:hypothetical protein n=1 Tax=Amycolatopsis sp. NPDC051102 TaxID=3155163 RepID=UPI0034260495